MVVSSGSRSRFWKELFCFCGCETVAKMTRYNHREIPKLQIHDVVLEMGGDAKNGGGRHVMTKRETPVQCSCIPVMRTEATDIQ